MRKTTTGIYGLDAQLKGGYPVGSTILLLAPPTNAAQTFPVQFAAGGLLTEDEVVYVNTDRPLEDVMRDMADVEERLQGNKEAFDAMLAVDIFQERFDSAIHGHGLDKDMLRRVQTIASKEREGDYRIALDSLSFFIERSGWTDVRDFLEYAVLSTRRGSGVLLLNMVQDLHDPKVETYVKQLCDGWIGLGAHRQGLQTTPYLQIGKMPGTQLTNRVLPYEETDKGIWLETAMRVF